MSHLRETAAQAATKVRSRVGKHSHPEFAWLYPRDCEDDIAPVVKQWLENPTNREHVSQKTGKQWNSDPSKNIFQSFAVVWTQISGTLRRPFPGKYLVIIGLEYVDKNNGFPVFEEKKQLDHGEYVIVPGDQDIVLSDHSGGISLLVILDMDLNAA